MRELREKERVNRLLLSSLFINRDTIKIFEVFFF